MHGDHPIPEPSGSLRPPVRHPPTAVGLATPPAPDPSVPHQQRSNSPLLRFVRRLAMVPMDLADWLATSILRRKQHSPPSP